MGRNHKKRNPRNEAPAPSPPVGAPEDGLRRVAAPWRGRACRIAGFVGAVFVLAWCILCLRAAQHYAVGRTAESAGNLPEAVREYETAVGCCAPLNPYCGAAAGRMWDLGQRVSATDPPLSKEIRDRLLRTLRGTRGLLQPHAALLEMVQSCDPARPPRDPRGGLFLLSVLALTVGMGAWWHPVAGRLKVGLGLAGLAAWASLLYLC